MLVRLSVGKQRTSGVWWGGGAASSHPHDLCCGEIFTCHMIEGWRLLCLDCLMYRDVTMGRKEL